MKKLKLILLCQFSVFAALAQIANNANPDTSLNLNKIILDDLYAGNFAIELERISQKYNVVFQFNKEKYGGLEFFARPMNESLHIVLMDVCKANRLRFFVDINGHIQIVGRNEKVDIAKIRMPDAIKTYDGPPKAFNITITGTVKSTNSGEALPNASVNVFQKNKSVLTNVDGQFTIMDVPSDTCTLYVSYIGYQSRSVYLTPETAKNLLSIELYPNDANVLTEVVVTSKKEGALKINVATPGVMRMTPATLAKLPNIGEKDIMRSFQLMPGVSAANENSSGLYVRGGTPDQNLVLYDGFTVYHVDHLFGFFSAFNTNAIKDVQLYKSAFPAKFGGRLSSVMDMVGKDGNSKKFSWGGDLSLLSMNAWAEAPLGKNVTTLFAFRKSWKSPLYKNLFEKFAGSNSTASQNNNLPFAQSEQTVKSYFYDLNGKITWKPNKKDVVSLSFYNGTDNMDNSRDINLPSFPGGGANRPSLDIKDLTNWGNLGASLKWSRKWNSKIYSNSLISYSNYYSKRDRTAGGSFTADNGDKREFRNGTLEDNDLKDVSLKSDWSYKLNNDINIEAGINTTANSIKYTYSQNDTSTILNRDDNGVTVSTYFQSKIQLLNNKFQLTPGIRINYFTPTSQFYTEPRLTSFYKINNRFSLKGAMGLHYQFANRITREDILQGSRDFWILSDGNKVPVSKAWQYTAGASYETNDYLFDIEAYYKKLDNITEYSLRFSPGGPTRTSYEENFYHGNGFARGIEFLLQKKTGNYNGWVSYTLGQVRNHFDVYGKNNYPANQDVNHEFKMVHMYKWRNFNFSATWVYATGRPYTAPEGAYTLTLLDGTTQDYINVGQKNGRRLPAYHRFDIAATYTFLNADDQGRATLGVSLFNLYNRQNTWYKEYEIVNNQLVGTDVKFLGFTPNLTFSLKF
jgi:ferric enterobactin receptor